MGSVGVKGGIRKGDVDTLLNSSIAGLGNRRKNLVIRNDNGSEAFRVVGNTNEDLRAFVRNWNQRVSTIQANADRTFAKTYREATARGMSDKQARRLANRARSEKLRLAMSNTVGPGTRFPGVSIQ